MLSKNIIRQPGVIVSVIMYSLLRGDNYIIQVGPREGAAAVWWHTSAATRQVPGCEREDQTNWWTAPRKVRLKLIYYKYLLT